MGNLKIFQSKVKHSDMKNCRAMFLCEDRGTAVKIVGIRMNFVHVLAGT